MAIQDLMLQEELQSCNDQIIVNVGIYSGLLPNIKHKVFEQGFGVINNVAFGGQFTHDSYGRFGGHDCFLSHIVQQSDRKILKAPMNQKCKEGR